MACSAAPETIMVPEILASPVARKALAPIDGSEKNINAMYQICI